MRSAYLLSHMRTGSTWLLKMLEPFYNGCEGGGFIKYAKPNDGRVLDFLNKGYIVKAHRWLHTDIDNRYPVISIVRGPLDRVTSVYYRFNRTHGRTYNSLFRSGNDGEFTQKERMVPFHSTKTIHLCDDNLNYIWTAYEWLLNDPKKELKAILDFLDISYSNGGISNAISNGARTKTTKNFRKGTIGDWKNLLKPREVKRFKPYQREYERILNEEIRRGNNNIRQT